MAGAAYSENARREGVSTLEQSRALAKWVERGVFPTKQALADALNVSRSHVSNLRAAGLVGQVEERRRLHRLGADRPHRVERVAGVLRHEADGPSPQRPETTLGEPRDLLAIVPLMQDTPYYASSYQERGARRAGLPEVKRFEGRLCPFS